MLLYLFKFKFRLVTKADTSNIKKFFIFENTYLSLYSGSSVI
nr:MAG TPA: hypothetical protein [Bacteriophage sp.]